MSQWLSGRMRIQRNPMFVLNGLIESSGPEPYAFTAATAVRLRRMLRLRRDLHVNFHGAAIIMDLVERLDGLERELARRGPEPPSTPNLEVTEIWIRTD